MSGLPEIELSVNGERRAARVEARTTLAEFLRERCQLTGTHLSCEQGVCGACTVLLDGEPVRACITWAFACEGRAVTTIEGLDDDAVMERLREAFSREHALQCGFCTPGMLITARDIVRRLPEADEARVRNELSGNLCRCTGYAGIVRAVCSVVGSTSGVAPTAAAVPAPAVMRDAVTAPSAAPASERRIAGAKREVLTGEKPPQIAQSIVVRGCDPARLWHMLADVRAAADCVPGARVERVEGDKLAGTVAVAFGPIRAAFSGTGTVTRDEATRTTTIRGAGADSLSKTSAHAVIVYRVDAEAGDPRAARLHVGMDYGLQGPLAQFSRSDLVRALVGQMVREFGANLEALAAGRRIDASGAARLGLFGLAWRWLRSRLAAALRARRRSD